MRSKVITDNTVEKIEIKDWGERLALIHRSKNSESTHTLILTPKEANEIADFIKGKK